PGVEHIAFLLDRAVAALLAGLRRSASHGDVAAGAAVPCRDAMSPPKLARDAPVVNIAHPLEVRLSVLSRRKANVPLLDGGNGSIGERLNLDKPLGRKTGLDDGFAAVAFADRVHVIAHPCEQTLGFKIVENLFARREAVKTGIGS